MSKRDPALLIVDILMAIRKIQVYTTGLDYNSFLADSRTVDAVERNFEIIGEAASQLPKAFQEANAQITWHSVISFRNRLIHGYFGVDYQIMWYIIEHDLQPLKEQFEQLRSMS